MATPLVITDAVKARIAEVVAYAQSHKLDFANMQERAKDPKPFEDIEDRGLEIPIGFLAVYSIEQQPPPLDWRHHLSFSSSAPGRVMDPNAVIILIGEFGIQFPGWGKCGAYFEEDSPRRPINIIIPFVPITSHTSHAE